MSYQVSKWLYLRALLTVEELKKLYADLGGPHLFSNGSVVEHPSYTTFFEDYDRYLKGEAFPPLIMTRDDKAVFPVEVRPGKFLIKPSYPVIQIREHTYIVTSDARVQSMVFGSAAMRWGLQFAYPGLFVDPDHKKVVDVLKEAYPNTALFKELQVWMRYNTRPAKIQAGEKIINATFRTGSHG